MSGRFGGHAILLTRPAETADGLIRLIEKGGGRAIHLPMQRIEPRRDTPRELSIGADEQPDDWWIFTSANAARHFIQHETPTRTPRVAAVGAATAAVLESIGLPADLIPSGDFSSEGLLASPELQDVDGQRILIITGQGGRGALAPALAGRGAEVRVAEVYRRVPTPIGPAQLAEALDQVSAAVVTNSEALERLVQLCPEPQRDRLYSRLLVVPTARVVEKARSIGFTGKLVFPELMNDAEIAQALADSLPADGTETRMTDTPPDAESPAPAPEAPASPDEAAERPEPAPRRAGAAILILLWLMVLLLSAAIAAGGWYGWQQLQRVEQLRAESVQQLSTLQQQLAEQRAQLDEQARSVADAVQAGRQLDLKLGGLEDRQQATNELIGELGQSVQGGRVEMQLAGIEQLLLLASERLQLAADIDGALLALKSADRRLARLADPRLFPVREAIARDRGSLVGLHRPDIASMSLSLGSLIRRAEGLPLDARTPTRFDTGPVAGDAAGDDPRWYLRAWASVSEALRSMYAVRRETREVRRLLPPEAQALTVELLRLKLEGARVALLRGDAVSYVEMLDAADSWLASQFQADAAAVIAARGEIDRLRGEPLVQVLPDISSGLATLRAYLDEQAP